jgi:lactoylglutathione lyase
LIRTPLPEIKVDEAIVANPDKGGRIQLAVWHERSGPLDMGTPALWKLYIYTDDIDDVYGRALDFGAESITEPFVTPRWPTKIAFVKDPDGYLVEFVQRLDGVGDDLNTRAWVAQYCINVTDIEATIRFYDRMGITVQSRTEIEQAWEAVLVNRNGKGQKIQLAQQKEQRGPIDMGTSMWKLYVYTDDIGGLHQTLVDAGCPEVRAPARTPRWPTTISFIADPDGYQIELVQRHES